MVAEHYAHTLIARSNAATPTAAQVQAFVSSVIQLGVIPGTPETVIRVVTGHSEVPNPFTGGLLRVPTKKSRSIKPSELSSALHSVADYEVATSGEGVPRLAPLPLPAESPKSYFVGVTVVVSSESRSTSDTYNGFDAPLVKTPLFGEPCDSECNTGYFSNLHTGSVIEVPEAGAARFWIEFELGKFLFPQITDYLKMLSPPIVNEAERIFGIEFVQGCHWGA